MKLHFLFNSNYKIQYKNNYSLLGSNSFQLMANLATKGLKQYLNVIFSKTKEKNTSGCPFEVLCC